MSLPIATRLVTILRAEGLEAVDSLDPQPAFAAVATNVRAVIGRPRGSERTQRAEASTLRGHLLIDPVPCGLTNLDRIVDDEGLQWNVEWTHPVHGLGLDHITAGVVRYHGEQP